MGGRRAAERGEAGGDGVGEARREVRREAGGLGDGDGERRGTNLLMVRTKNRFNAE